MHCEEKGSDPSGMGRDPFSWSTQAAAERNLADLGICCYFDLIRCLGFWMFNVRRCVATCKGEGRVCWTQRQTQL